MAQILFVDYLGVYHHHLALELNQICSGPAQKKHRLSSRILCCTELDNPSNSHSNHWCGHSPFSLLATQFF